MIIPNKIYTENPFVDNVLYYAKLLALNCSIKDEAEALANETKETLEAGNTYIACIEGTARYEMFHQIPKEILENYIQLSTNLDIYIKDPQWLKNRLNSYSQAKRNAIEKRLSKLACSVYVDHYDIMTEYIYDVGTSWVEDHYELYKACKRGTVGYMELFDELPMKTCLRIIRAFLNSHGYIDLAILWDPESPLTKLDLKKIELAARTNTSDDISGDYMKSTRTLLLDSDYVSSQTNYDSNASNYKNQFNAYVATRSDEAILTELSNISQAMRDVFVSHFETMRDRKYFSYLVKENYRYADDAQTIRQPAWMGYIYDLDVYKAALRGQTTWQSLYSLMPGYAIKEALIYVFGEKVVNENDLLSVTSVEEYLSHCNNATAKRIGLNTYMTNDYLNNYQLHLNNNIYNRCVNEDMSIYDMYEYLPKETLKSIIATELPENTNIHTFSESKDMLNSFLQTLDPVEAQRIRDGITTDMMSWYPKNHVERNNYYRALIGLPPLDKNGDVIVDTLTKTWHIESNEFIEFGNKYVKMCPSGMYPDVHWSSTEIYKFDNYDIGLLRSNGVLDAYVEGCNSTTNLARYRYIKYLGDEKLDLYVCRKGMNFDLIGVPSCDDDDIKNKFIDAYATNQDCVIRTVYDDAYNFQSDYYNKFMIIFILINTIMDLITSIPDYIIKRDVFDARCIKYMFEAFGVPYYSEIPLKYQKAMLKNLNTLIKYKSSTRNMVDISKLFGFNDVQVFGYYMMKDRNVTASGDFVQEANNQINYNAEDVYILYSGGDIVDATGRHFCKMLKYPHFTEDYYLKKITVIGDDGQTTTKTIINNDREDLYVYDKLLNEMVKLKDTTYFTKIKADTKPFTLKFVKVPVNDKLTAYKGIEDNRLDYDEVTLTEETWDGGIRHERVKQDIMDYSFNAVKSKYISIDAITNLTDIAFQTSYFYNMLFDDLYIENNLTVNVNSIKTGHAFRLTDIIFTLFAMTYYYMGLEDKIMYSPTQILYVKGYTFTDAVNQALNDPRHFTQTAPQKNIFDVNERISKESYNYLEKFKDLGLRVKGFNLKVDIDALEKWVNDEWQMSLEDFIVSTNTDQFGQIVTLKQFYSLNNSYYQKSIFSGPMTPRQYNNIIKYAYDYRILEKEYVFDTEHNLHSYIKEYEIDTESPDLYNFLRDVVALVSKKQSTRTYNDLLDRVKLATNYRRLSDTTYVLDKIFAVENFEELTQLAEKIKTNHYSYLIEPEDPSDVYIYNHTIYAYDPIKDHKIPVYNRYIQTDEGNYTAHDKQYYIYNQDIFNYNLLVNGYIYIRDPNGVYTFATEHIYTRLSDGSYKEIDYDKFSYIDQQVDARILNFGDYFVKDSDGNWILKPDNCYIEITGTGQDKEYVLLDNIGDNYIKKDDCYLETSPGIFTQFKYTDYYNRTHQDNTSYNQMIYQEKPLYVRVEYETSVQDADGHYYRELADFYQEDGFSISKNKLFVKDSDGRYISESDLLTPANCWFYDEITGQYCPVIDYQYVYRSYEQDDRVSPLYTLILQNNYDYNKYAYEASSNSYIMIESTSRYVYNSDKNLITVLENEPTYADTNKIITVLNTDILEDTLVGVDVEGYNPSLHDNKWDENDWYYGASGSDPDNVFGMHNENQWYYRKPTAAAQQETTLELAPAMGSGLFFESESFIGSLEMVKDEKYYVSFDIVTNFDGTVQAYLTSDKSVITNLQRNYDVKHSEQLHISQIVTSKANMKPQLRILKYNFNNNPIHIGDYVIISNLKIDRAYNENYIPRDVPNIDSLANIYNTNKAIYKYLLTQMHNTHDKKRYELYKTLYDSLMTSEYNKEIFKLYDGTYATTYTDFLKTRDTVLYELLIGLKELDFDVMQERISNYIIDICNTLNTSLQGKGLDNIYAFFPAVSASFIQHYLFKVINWFKSWKVHLLGINTLYKMGNGITIDGDGNILADSDGDEYSVKILYGKESKIKLNSYLKESFIKDTIKINPLDEYSPKYDMEDSVTKKSDKIPLFHRIRVISTNGNKIEFTDNLRNMHLILNDPSTNVYINNQNELSIKTINGDEFVSNGNKLILRTDEHPEDVFLSQIIDEINRMSGDYITSPREDDDSE